MIKLQKIWNSQKNVKNMQQIYDLQDFFCYGTFYVVCWFLACLSLKLEVLQKSLFQSKSLSWELLFKHETILWKMFFLVREYYKLWTFQLSTGMEKMKYIDLTQLSCNISPWWWYEYFQSDRSTDWDTDITDFIGPHHSWYSPPPCLYKGGSEFSKSKREGIQNFPIKRARLVK